MGQIFFLLCIILDKDSLYWAFLNQLSMRKKDNLSTSGSSERCVFSWEGRIILP